MAKVPVARVATAATPMDILDATPAVFISQNISITELVTGCEMRNKYDIVEADPATRQRGTGYPIFKALESSTCCQRQCCGPMREFNMAFFQPHPTEEKGQGPLLMNIHRPFKCCSAPGGCCRACQTEIHVMDPAGTRIGHTINKCSCCSMVVDAGPPTTPAGDLSEPWYTISGAICQIGNLCRCPCGACKRIVFNILDGRSGAVVGEICHVWAGCVKEMVEADNYTIVFPEKATAEQKCSLIATTIMLDFLYFERKQGNHN